MRLGDLDALKAEFERLGLGEHSLIERVFADGVYAVIENAPTIDAVSVVRCRDCKHYKPRKQSKHWNNVTPCCMRSVAVKVPPDGFCSFGERKDGDGK